MRIKRHPDSPLKQKARRGFRGYPIATVAFYGPDDTRASKVAVGIVAAQDAEPVALHRWFDRDGDVRKNPAVASERSSSSSGFTEPSRWSCRTASLAVRMRRGSTIRTTRCARSAHSGRTATAGLAIPCSKGPRKLAGARDSVYFRRPASCATRKSTRAGATQLAQQGRHLAPVVALVVQ